MDLNVYLAIISLGTVLFFCIFWGGKQKVPINSFVWVYHWRAQKHVQHAALVYPFPIYSQTNLTNDGRPGKIKSGNISLLAHTSVPALLQAAAGRPVEPLGLDERILLSITTVSSAEWLPLITANIISHEESQSALRSIGGDKDASSEAFQEHSKAGSWWRHTRRTVWLFAFSLFRGGVRGARFAVKWLNGDEMKGPEFIAAVTVMNVMRRCLSFDASYENVCRTMMAITECSLVRHRIKDSIFCLSDVSMSKVIWWDTLSETPTHPHPTLLATPPE